MKCKTLKVRNVVFGEGMPKICVPIVGKTRDEIVSLAGTIMEYTPDCIEWRLDYYCDYCKPAEVIDVLRKIRKVIGDTVLLVTIRSKGEGGNADISAPDYCNLYKCICESSLCDMIDIEAYMEEGLLKKMCKMAHENGVIVLASNHDFSTTPSGDELLKRLIFMDKEGADIPKLAVMPNNEGDVLTLLRSIVDYRENGGEKPVITMSMGSLGMISRMAGEIFGSALTFAAVGEGSASGQLPIDELRSTLEIIHSHL